VSDQGLPGSLPESGPRRDTGSRRGSSGRPFLTAKRRDAIAGYLFVGPWIIGMSVFYIGPMVASAVYSLTSYPIIASPKWVGLDNYRQIIDDPQFAHSLRVTIIYTIFSVALYLGGALSLALLCNRRLPGIGIVRTIVFLPSLVPVFGMAILWGWFFNTDFGLANYLLGLIGIGAQGFFQSDTQALTMCVTVSGWALGSAFVVFLAGLQSIPNDLYEAITVDGASSMRKFWHVTLPMLSPVILFNLVIGVILSFQVFDIGWALTNGGPGDSTLFFVLYIWRKAFQDFQMGYASALAWILFVLIVAITAVIFRTARYWVHYEGAR
jgi:multiple sugar transport system permease protein